MTQDEEIAALRAENARLRDWLIEQEIAACKECGAAISYHFKKEPNCEACAAAVDDRIRAALGGENG